MGTTYTFSIGTTDRLEAALLAYDCSRTQQRQSGGNTEDLDKT